MRSSHARPVVSDAHFGLWQPSAKASAAQAGSGAMHFMRNVLAYIPHKEKESFSQQLKSIWLAPARKLACKQIQELCRLYKCHFSKVIRCLEDGLEDSLVFYAFPQLNSKKYLPQIYWNPFKPQNLLAHQCCSTFPNPDTYI